MFDKGMHELVWKPLKGAGAIGTRRVPRRRRPGAVLLTPELFRPDANNSGWARPESLYAFKAEQQSAVLPSAHIHTWHAHQVRSWDSDT